MGGASFMFIFDGSVADLINDLIKHESDFNSYTVSMTTISTAFAFDTKGVTPRKIKNGPIEIKLLAINLV
jgi:hypothetical protein